MSRRIDIELTSLRDQDSWTWRAVGAREPKGVIATSLVPKGAAVGDALRVEADFFVEGIEITTVLPAKGERKEAEMLEILGSGREQGGGVTTSLVGKGRGRGRGREGRDRDGGDSRGRGRGRDGRSGGGRDGRSGGGRDGRSGEGRDRDSSRDRKRGSRPPRQERPAPPVKPKPKRLRPGRTHRNEVLGGLPEDQRALAEQVLRGGVPGLRNAVEEQNQRNAREDRPAINPVPLLQLAEDLLPGLKQAEWHDRADAALADIAELDLRDLRSVVVAAESGARSEEARALAEQLRDAVSSRVDQDQTAWLNDISEALTDDRAVRALRMSSRPPKAGAPLPPALSTRLVDAASAALSDDTGPQRWGTVLDAVAYSPIRQSVTPAGTPSRPNDELLQTVKRLASRVPEIAALFGIEPSAPPKKRRRSRGGAKGTRVPKPPPAPPTPDQAAKTVPASPIEAPAEESVAEEVVAAAEESVPSSPVEAAAEEPVNEEVVPTTEAAAEESAH